MKLKETLVVGISIIVGFLVMGLILNSTLKSISSELMSMNKIIIEEMSEDRTYDSHRYELISPNDCNILLFDTKTGEYWRKFIDSSSGPTEWEKEVIPGLSEK